jgi:single-strand DNA-binding protein
MNKVFIVGNLTRDPELRSTRDGISVCSFTVAVNRRVRNAEAGQPEADFFRVSAWRGLGENCAKYLAKGRKVAVTGSVSVSTYTGNDGNTRASLEVTADDVEFLTPRGEVGDVPAPAPRAQAAPAAPQSNGFVQVDDDELPF